MLKLADLLDLTAKMERDNAALMNEYGYSTIGERMIKIGEQMELSAMGIREGKYD